MKIIGIDIYSFSIAGSIVLFFISIEMILGLEMEVSVVQALLCGPIIV
ncbi:MAG TPA: MarC family protein [Candidatus Angelobacter sp.]|nr:MarC family protein [Candidatus Angelobacter sp.]